jgi:hypothetical protein
MLVIDSLDVSLLLTTTDLTAVVFPTPCVVLKASDVGENVSGAMPVPVRETTCAPEVPVTVSVPVRAPVAVGLKVMLTLQDFFAAREVPQLFVWAKSPLIATVSGIATLRLLVTLALPAPLVEPTATEPKLSDVGETVWA